MKTLYKSTLVIWSAFDPKAMEIDQLASEAVEGMAYCSKQKVERVEDPGADPDWDGSEFFGDV